MKKLAVILLLITISCSLNKNVKKKNIKREPFAVLQSLIEKDRSWFSNRDRKAYLINKEREKLGKDFKKELLKLIGDNINHHYWVASIISSESYLYDKKPMNRLALQILNRGISLIKKSISNKERAQEVSFRICAAILAYKLGFKSQAKKHKKIANKLFAKDKMYAGGFPALNKKNYKIYTKKIKIKK